MRWLLPVALCLLSACTDSDGDGVPDRRDCADLDPTVHPNATEICNGKDDDCDGLVDEDVALVAYWDRDGDGWGDTTKARRVCALPDDGSERSGDCDDTDPLTHPMAPEICDNLDNDCDDEIDEDAPQLTFFVDEDGDGHGTDRETVEACSAPPGFATTNDDCDDADGLTHPGAPERCDGRDNDCDDVIDEETVEIPYWPDADGDGYAATDATDAIYTCAPGPGLSADRLDCDDADATIGPDATEVRGNQVDEDCDGYRDEYGVPAPYATVQDALAAAPDGAVVQFDAGTHVGTLDLTGRSVTLAGEGCGRTLLYGDQAGSVVRMDGGSIENLSLEAGTGTFLVPLTTDGGGLLVEGDVTAERICVRRNSATRRGGGIAVAAGTLTLLDSEVTDNEANVQGGGIYVATDAHLVARRTVVSGNRALGNNGGGISVEAGTLDLSASVVAGNTSGWNGGGVSVSTRGLADGTQQRATATIAHTTFHANAAVNRASGLWNQGSDLVAERNVFTSHPGLPVIEDSATIVTADASLDQDPVTTLSTQAFRGNQTTDWETHWFVDALRLDPAYVNDDPALAPAAWDLRPRPGSAVRAAGVGAFTGPDAMDDPGADADLDGIPDLEERHFGLRVFEDDAAEDPDADNLTNLDEIDAGTDPHRADTDDDGITDDAELAAGSDPRLRRDQAPVADAGAQRWVLVGELASVDGAMSWDPNADTLSFTWTVVGAPIGSSVLGVMDPTAPRATFTPDLPGPYRLSLVVSDGAATHADEVVVEAVRAHVVPEDAPTVQAAIALAATGDTIAVRPGTWTGPLDLSGKDLRIVGLGSRALVVLDAGAQGPVLTAGMGEALTLASLTLTNGWTPGDGGGIHAPSGSAVALFDVALTDNVAGLDGGGLYLAGGSLHVEDSLVHRNTALDDAAGFYLLDTEAQIVRTTFADNAARDVGGAARVLNPGPATTIQFDNCVFAGNSAVEGAAIEQTYSRSRVEIRHALMVGNTGNSVLFDYNGVQLLMGSIVALNDATVVVSGGREAGNLPTVVPLSVATWGNTGPMLLEGLVPTAPVDLFLDEDPGLALWTRDGDATNDLLTPALVSALQDAGFPDWTDVDGSRADVGPAAGALAEGAALRFAVDTDGDGLSDGWEAALGLDPRRDDAGDDPDADGRTNRDEFIATRIAARAVRASTHPTLSDTDGDGVADGDEAIGGTDPTDPADHRPVARPGAAYLGQVGQAMTLDGAGSSDPNGDPLTYGWRILGAPEGSSAVLTDATTPFPTLVPDVAGRYLIGLVVADASASSPEARAIVSTSADDAVAALSPGSTLRLGPGAWDVAWSGLPVGTRVTGSGVDETYLQGLGGSPIVNVSTAQSLTLSDLTLTGSAGALGGAIQCSGADLTLTRIRAEFNASRQGGAIKLNNCDAVFHDVALLDNDASDHGGALHVTGGTLSWVGGEIARNHAQGQGGALYALNAVVNISNVRVHHNEAWQRAGGILIYGGVAELHHLTVVANAGTFGALYFDGPPEPGDDESLASVTHSIFQENSAYGIFKNATVRDTNVTSSTNGFSGNASGDASPPYLAVGGHVKANARFVALDPFGTGLFDDLHLRHDSPMIDAGTGSDPDGSLADLGAYGGVLAPPDFDRYYADLDLDGLADGWELEHGLDPTVAADAGDDGDSDGLTNLEELIAGTRPDDADTDGDGIPDGIEVSLGDDPRDGSGTRPVANAGADQVVPVGTRVTLDGALSSDPNGDPLAWTWRLVTQPGRSLLGPADLAGATTQILSFTPNIPGAYEVELVVGDGAASSAPDLVRVTVEGEVRVPEDYGDVAMAVDAAADGSVIRVAAGVWPTRIVLGDKGVRIVGAGREQTILDAERSGPHVFAALSDVDLHLEALTLMNGVGAQGGAIRYGGTGTVSLRDVTLSHNDGVYGGAVYLDDATLEASGLRVVHNVASRYGGGLYLADVTATITQSLFAGNAAIVDDGGAMYAYRSAVTVSNAIFSDNQAEGGGALLIVTDPVLPATLTLDHVTATYNVAEDNGAFLHLGDVDGLAISNSILVGASTVSTIQADADDELVYTHDYTLMDVPEGNDFLGFSAPPVGVGNQYEADPMFASTSADGDWTDETWILGPGSPALDAGDPNGPPDPDGSPADLGAFGGALGDWSP